MTDIVVTRNTDISSYFPLLMGDVREFKHISESENPEFNMLWSVLRDVFSDQFVLDSNENGVKRWENMLHIIPKDTDTLIARKREILARLGEMLPYTWRMLIRIMDSFIGENNYTIELKHLEYFIDVYINLTDKNLNYKLLSSLRGMFKRVLPANIGYSARYLYNAENTNICIGAMTTIATYVDILPFVEKEYHSKGQHLTGAKTYTGTVLEVMEKEMII